MELSLSVQQSRGYATAVSWGGQYGERGFDETLAFLRAHVGETVPVVRKDLAYYLVLDRPEQRRAWIYSKIFRDLGKPGGGQQLAQALVRDDVRYIVVERFSVPTLAPAALAACCRRVATFGDFQILVAAGGWAKTPAVKGVAPSSARPCRLDDRRPRSSSSGRRGSNDARLSPLG
jgi:hypothetical protein